MPTLLQKVCSLGYFKHFGAKKRCGHNVVVVGHGGMCRCGGGLVVGEGGHGGGRLCKWE